ncbi:MAG: diaminopimelate epimerase, partial [Eggerthellaceae bacterium]|nr:diaminopimelate epimerase [Eggerthellaceae bacterium]
MKYEFAKLHGCGNDFVMINDMDGAIELTTQQVEYMCDRHFGVGADGVILVKPSPRPECAAYMDYINADGTRAQMCGNGVRCFAKFLVDRGIVDPAAGRFVADTLAGPKPIDFTVDSDGKMVQATVDMGEPILRAAEVPTRLPETDTSWGPAVVEQLVNVGDTELAFTCVSMGNPHVITFVEDPATFPVTTVGPVVECADAFPEKTNVEFACVDGDQITMRVWERGCGETLACGTGSCATTVAAHITGRAPRKVQLHLLGGTLGIEWRESDNHLYLTGPAVQSF